LLAFASAATAGDGEKKNFVVALDVGHTPEKPGAISARGITEYSFNLNLAKIVLGDLQRRGFTGSFLIEERGTGKDTLFKRTAFAQEKKAQLYLAIHHDSVQPQYLSAWTFQGKQQFYSDRFHGYSIFYSQKNPFEQASLEFARLLGNGLRAGGFVPTAYHAEKIPGENRQLVDKELGIYRFDDLVVLRTADMPAVLLEAGVIVNREEELRLGEPAYQKKIAAAIGEAVSRFASDAASIAKGPCQ
jgi:N-acetylmuramoyl-L-alanine amidase